MNLLQRGILFFIIIFGFGLRHYVSDASQLRPWDERFHALVAKDIWKSPLKPMLYKNPVLEYDYRYWDQNHVWLHKPPLTLWIIGTSLEIFGNHPTAVRIPSLIFSTLSILLLFFLSRKIMSVNASLFTVLIFSHYPHGILLASGLSPTDHVDTLFAFFILLGVFLGIEWKEDLSPKRTIFLGFILALAYLTKSLPSLVLIPVWYLMFSKTLLPTRRVITAFVTLLAMALILVLPWDIYTKTHFPLEAANESEYNWRHLFEPIEGHGKPWSYFLASLIKNFGWIWILAFPIAHFLIWRKGIKNYLWLISWIWIPLLVFSISTTKMEGYIFISIPGFCILFGIILDWILSNKNKRLGLILGSIFIVLSLLRPSLALSKLTNKKNSRDRSIAWPKEYSELKGESEFVVFNEKNYLEAMFFFGGTFYKFLPNRDQLDKARSTGIPVYIRQPKGQEPDSLKGAIWIP